MLFVLQKRAYDSLESAVIVLWYNFLFKPDWRERHNQVQWQSDSISSISDYTLPSTSNAEWYIFFQGHRFAQKQGYLKKACMQNYKNPAGYIGLNPPPRSLKTRNLFTQKWSENMNQAGVFYWKQQWLKYNRTELIGSITKC